MLLRCPARSTTHALTHRTTPSPPPPFVQIYKITLALKKKDECATLLSVLPAHGQPGADKNPLSGANLQEEVVQAETDGKCEFVLHRKDPESALSTRAVLCNWVNKRTPVGFLAVGMVGRKGPKDDPKVLGSAADYSLRQAACTCVIVKEKPRNPHTEEPAVFLVAYDGSARAKAALAFATERRRAGTDRCLVLHVATDTEKASRCKEEVTSAHGDGVEWVDMAKQGGKTVSEHISGFIDCTEDEGTKALGDADVDYLCIGVDCNEAAGFSAENKDARTLGSIAESCVKSCGCTVIVCSVQEDDAAAVAATQAEEGAGTAPGPTTEDAAAADEAAAAAQEFTGTDEENKAATKLQAVKRGADGRKQVQDKKENAAATKVQAVQRGKQDRKRVQDKKDANAAAKEFPGTDAENSAATRLQAVQRGKQDRAKVAEKVQDKKENDAATKMQAVQRGKADRAKVAEKKAAKAAAEAEAGGEEAAAPAAES